jgi:hypothetical protein
MYTYRVKDKVIFIWIPKCAGTSIYTVLKKYGCQKLRENKEFRNFKNHGWVTFGHVSINYLLSKGFVERDYFNEAFKFCVVRNPWDRFVSIYKYLKYDKIMTFNEFVDFLYKKIENRSTFYYKSLKRVYSYSVSKDIMDVLNKLKIKIPLPEIGPYNVRGFSQANNQVDWILNEDGDLLVDYVCRFENLTEDFKVVSQHLGIKQGLPHINKSRRAHYRNYYTEDTIKKVKNLYQRDIDKLEYEY